jgi:hypothetical protein
MGTSASHGSPRDTLPWQAVRALYEAGCPASILAGAIARALSDDQLAALAAAPALATATHELARPGGALDDRLLEAWAGHESIKSEMVRTAMIRAALVADGEPEPEKLRCFAAEYAAAIVEHVVARDAEEFVGTHALPHVGSLSDLVEAVGGEARNEILRLARDDAGTSHPSEDESGEVASLVLGGFAALRRRSVGIA